MIRLHSISLSCLVIWSCLIWQEVYGQMLGDYGGRHRYRARQNGNNNNNNNGPDTSAFNLVNGRIFTPGLGIILAPQPFTPMGGDFLHIALDVSGDGALRVPPQNPSDPLTQVYNFTLFLTSNTLGKNFTISNLTSSTPPFADIMNQELGSTVKHINFEWPSCLVGDGNSNNGATARGDYNISIHQNFRLNGADHYSIFNLPISVTNSIEMFPGANQLLTRPPPGPLNGNGGRMNCDAISNPLMDISELIQSVNNPPGQPFQDIAIETAGRSDGGQVGGFGNGNGNSNGNGNGNGNGQQNFDGDGNGQQNFNGNGNGQENFNGNGNGQQIGNNQGGSQNAIGSLASKGRSIPSLDISLMAALAVFGASGLW